MLEESDGLKDVNGFFHFLGDDLQHEGRGFGIGHRSWPPLLRARAVGLLQDEVIALTG